MTQQSLQIARVRELRRVAESSEIAVEVRGQPVPDFVDRATVDRGAARCLRIGVFQGIGDSRAVALDLRRIRSSIGGHSFEQVRECRHAMSRLIGKIRPGKEGQLFVGRQEHRQGPPTSATGDQLMRDLVDLIDVRPLLAVDLDVDEMLVHELGDLLVLEALVLHHVAPVAGRVADRQQHGLARLAGELEGLVTPRVPVDRIVGVLEQVGAGLVCQAIGHQIFPMNCLTW